MSEDKREAQPAQEASGKGAAGEEDLELDVAGAGGGKKEPGISWGMMVGASLGFGVGMVFVLAGFWKGLLAVLFTVVGAAIGKLIWDSSGGSHA